MDVYITTLEKILLILIAGGIVGLIGCGIMLIKNQITYKNLILITCAIHKHNIDSANHGAAIDYDCMKDYDRAFYNLFYWGYKKLVPPEIYKKIRPYIAEVKQNERN